MPFRGDANVDDAVNLSDAVFTLEYLFLGGPAPQCFEAADASGDGTLDMTDPVVTLQTLYMGSGEVDFQARVSSCDLSGP